MVTGRKAFEGKSQASLISAIMTSEPPPLSQLQRLSPPALDHVVGTCLAKNPNERWQTAGDVGRQLKWIREGGSQPPSSCSGAMYWNVPMMEPSAVRDFAAVGRAESAETFWTRSGRR